MTSPPTGLKPKVFGGVLAALGAATMLVSAALGGEPDPFYLVIVVAGVSIVLYGAMRR